MVIPLHVNYLEFYEKCREKGITVQSRLTGVCAYVYVDKKPRWKAQFQRDGRYLLLGTYPFTKEGEEKAAEVFKEFVAEYDSLSEQVRESKFKGWQLKYKSPRRKKLFR